MLKQIRKNFFFQAVLIGLTVFNLIPAVALGASGTTDQELFIKARKMYYNAEAPQSEVIKVLDRIKESLANLPEGFDKYYWSANVAYLSGEMAEVAGDKKKAAGDFTESNELIGKALNFNPKSSDANRILADTIMRLMDYKGAIYTMSKGPQAIKILNKALSLDEKNYAAMNSLGMYYIEAPAIGGGSVTKGIDILQKALGSKDQFENFISDIWLGKAFQKKNNSSEGEQYFQKALGIYPNSPWVKELLQ